MKDLEPRYERGEFYGPTSFVGPAYRVVELPAGTDGRYVTDYVKMADRAVLERARSAGHEYEGFVRIKGKRYSAFTSGGENPDGGNGCIIVRSKSGRSMR